MISTFGRKSSFKSLMIFVLKHRAFKDMCRTRLQVKFQLTRPLRFSPEDCKVMLEGHSIGCEKGRKRYGNVSNQNQLELGTRELVAVLSMGLF